MIYSKQFNAKLIFLKNSNIVKIICFELLEKGQCHHTRRSPPELFSLVCFAAVSGLACGLTANTFFCQELETI